MREIKFRGKTKDGRWVEGVPIKNGFGKLTFICAAITDNLSCPMEKIHNFCIEVVPETVTQYTGLKDSKGNEVYERDVLKCIFVVWSRPQSFGKTKSDVITENALVVYEECSYKVRFPDGTTENLFRFDSASEEFEVIGNRFENPELVEDAEWEQK